MLLKNVSFEMLQALQADEKSYIVFKPQETYIVRKLTPCGKQREEIPETEDLDDRQHRLEHLDYPADFVFHAR